MARRTDDRTVEQIYSSENPEFTFGSHEMLHIALNDILGPSPHLFYRNINKATPYNLGLKATLRWDLGELTAVVLDLQFMESNPQLHLYSKVYQELNSWPSIAEILDPYNPLLENEFMYPLVSFLSFLLTQYSWDDYRQLWNYETNFQLSQAENIDLALSQPYGKSLPILEEE